MPRKTTSVKDNLVPGTEDNDSWVNGIVIIDTVGYLGQHLYETAKDKGEFIAYVSSYDFTLDELRDFLHGRGNPDYGVIFEQRKKTSTRVMAYKKMYDRFEKEKNERENPDLDESIASLKMNDDDYGWSTKTKVYYPHPADRKFVIDNSPDKRALILLQQEIKNLQSTLSNAENTESLSYVAAAASTPTPSRVNETVLPRKTAVMVSTPNEISEEDLRTKLNNELENYEFKVEALYESNRSSRFRVVCEKWTKSSNLCDSDIWKNRGLNCRAWRGPIQDLKLKTKIRRLLKGLDSKTTENEILEKVKTLYNLDVKITVEKFIFPKQKDKNTKNFVVQIESNDNSSFITDEITKYCLTRNVKVRPWKGKVPNTQKTLPTFT